MKVSSQSVLRHGLLPLWVILAQVGLRASLRDRDLLMAQHYDMAARKNFAERAFRGDDGFDVDVASKSLDEDILKCAEDHYDMLSAKKLAGRRAVKPAALRAAPRTPPADDFHKSKVRMLGGARVCEVRSCNLVCC